MYVQCDVRQSGGGFMQAGQENLLPAPSGKGHTGAGSSGEHVVYGADTQEATGLPRVPVSTKAMPVTKLVCTLH